MTTGHELPAHQAHGDVLFIASASPEHVRTALRGPRAAYPDASFDVIPRKGTLAAVRDVGRWMQDHPWN